MVNPTELIAEQNGIERTFHFSHNWKVLSHARIWEHKDMDDRGMGLGLGKR